MSSKMTSRTNPVPRFKTFLLRPWFTIWKIEGPREGYYGFYSRRRDAVRGFTRTVNRNRWSRVKLCIENRRGEVDATVHYL